jgi:hypothetical protein
MKQTQVSEVDNVHRVARLKFEKIAIFVRKNSQNSHLIISPKSAKILFQNITVQGKVKMLIKKSKS